MVVNHLSFIGTPKDVEEFRLMCRGTHYGSPVIQEFTFNGMLPGKPDDDRGALWGCYSDACSQVVEVVPTQYTVKFLTDGYPITWLGEICSRWILAFVTLVSWTFAGDEVTLRIRKPRTDLVTERHKKSEFFDDYEEDEEWTEE